MSDSIPVTPARLSAMLISALRYALGRSTYIVGETCDWVRAYWPHIHPRDRETMLCDLRRWLDQSERHARLPWSSDMREWRALLEWMEAQP